MTTTDSTMQLATAIDEVRSGADLMIRCPAHDDGTASLHVSHGQATDTVVLKCHAGCGTKDILDAVNLDWQAIMASKEDTTVTDVWTPAGPASNVYPYHDQHGRLVYEVLRVPQPGGRKTFRQRVPDPAAPGGYSWKLDGVDRVLYRLPQITEAIRAGRTIYVPEGEKDVDTLVSVGLDATTAPQGAGKWYPQFSETLAGATVVLLSDVDNVGRAHTREVREQLIAVGARVAIMEPPAPHKDITDLYLAGGSIDDCLTTTPFEEEQRIKFGIDVLDVIRRKVEDVEWIIPGVLAKRERLLVTGPEGHGKSTLFRQFAAQVAAGINPFSLARYQPKRVLYIDAENEPGQVLESWNQLLKLAEYHADGVERGNLIILEEWDNADLDLAGPAGTAWLHERIHGYQPDLCLIGPLTNVVGRDLKEDEPVRRLKAAINSARSICGTGFIMEHHAPHKNPSDKRRSVRPYGSSMFLRWPDYGYGLSPTDDKGVYEWQRTRWPRVRTRAWPEALRWGQEDTSEWPWVETKLPEGI